MNTPMTASIKEALRIARGYVADDVKRKPSGYDPSSDLRVIDAALASLSCGEARERIALQIWHRFADNSTVEWEDETHKDEFLLCADAILATGLVPVEAAKATDGDEAYEIGKRDGYESAIQDLDIATGGDGEFRGSTIPDETVDVPAMKARVIARLRDESRLRQCTICGFTVDTSFAAVKPSADFTTRGRAKSLPNESAIRADERERCAEIADCMADEYDATSFASTNADQVAAIRSKEQAAHEIAAAIRAGRDEG